MLLKDLNFNFYKTYYNFCIFLFIVDSSLLKKL